MTTRLGPSQMLLSRGQFHQQNCGCRLRETPKGVLAKIIRLYFLFLSFLKILTFPPLQGSNIPRFKIISRCFISYEIYKIISFYGFYLIKFIYLLFENFYIIYILATKVGLESYIGHQTGANKKKLPLSNLVQETWQILLVLIT